MRVVALLIVVALIVYTVTVTIRYSKLKQVMKGLNKPELWLPKHERQDHARKLLRREDDEYAQKIIDQTAIYLKGALPQ